MTTPIARVETVVTEATATQVRVYVTGRFFADVTLNGSNPTVGDALDACKDRNLEWNGVSDLQITQNGHEVARDAAATTAVSDKDVIIVAVAKPTGN